MPRGFRIIGGRAQIESAVDDELAFHIQMRVDRLIAAGFSPDAARREALSQFGDVGAVRQNCVTLDEERHRLMQRASLFTDIRQDLAYAVRTIARSPGFAAVVVASLAIGIGANAAIFTLVDAVMLRALPVANPSRLFEIGDPARTNSHSEDTGPRADLLSYPLYRDLRDSVPIATGLAASGRGGRLDVVMTSGAVPDHPRGRFVSDNYFAVLGVHPAAGRVFFGSEDHTPEEASVAVLSYDYWIGRFNGDSAVLGRQLLVNGVRITVVGIAANGFDGEIVGAATDLWLPIGVHDRVFPNQPWLKSATDYWLLAIGRLAPTSTLPQARAAYTTVIQRRLVSELAAPGVPPIDPRRIKVRLDDGSRGFSRVRASYRAPLETLMVGVALVLLIVCANVANLLLARAIARGREIGVRLALGAERARIVRQLLTECALLGGMGAVGGLAIAWEGSRLLLALEADGSSAIPLKVSPDLPVLAFTAGVAVVAVAIFGLVPALRASKVDLAQSLGGRANVGSLGARGGRVPLGRVLLVGQVALSLVLLVGAGLLVRSLGDVQNGSTGVDRDHLLIVTVDAIGRGDTGVLITRTAAGIASHLAAVPGVSAVSYSENGLFSGSESSATMQPEGFVPSTAADTEAYYDHVGPAYAHAVGARLLAGRDIMPTDNDAAPVVVLINETMARFYFHTVNAVGKTIRFSPTINGTVVGVIADVKDHDLRAVPVRRFYAPYQQSTGGISESLTFEIRSAGDPARLVAPVRAAIGGVDPELAITDIDPLTTLMRDSIRQERLLARLAAGFGLLALLLAAIGLYGVMTYAIARRTSEMGLRVALGAQRWALVRMVMADAFAVVGIGLAVGIPIAALATRLLGSQLHGVGPFDPASFAVAVLVLAGSAAAAVVPPALRAAGVAPLVALQQE